jgi:hypothetical protein
MYRFRYVAANGFLDWPMIMMGMGDDIQVTSHFVLGMLEGLGFRI